MRINDSHSSDGIRLWQVNARPDCVPFLEHSKCLLIAYAVTDVQPHLQKMTELSFTVLPFCAAENDFN